MLLGLLFASITAIAGVSSVAEPTTDALQSDLQTAYSCKDIDGRKVWKGGLAYYIESYVYDGAQVDNRTNVAADAVLPADNTPETMQEFEQACVMLAPSANNGN